MKVNIFDAAPTIIAFSHRLHDYRGRGVEVSDGVIHIDSSVLVNVMHLDVVVNNENYTPVGSGGVATINHGVFTLIVSFHEHPELE